MDIIECIVTDLQQQPVDPQTYNVYTPALVFSAQPFTQTPACGYDLDYTIQIKDAVTGAYTPLPSWIDNTGSLDFSVFTDNPLNVGIYEISIIGSTPSGV